MKDNFLLPFFTGVFIPTWVITNTALSPGAKLCYGVLNQFLSDRQQPQLKDLALELGCSVRNVQHYVSDLKKAGLIEVVQRGLQLSNQYRLIPPAL